MWNKYQKKVEKEDEREVLAAVVVEAEAEAEEDDLQLCVQLNPEEERTKLSRSGFGFLFPPKKKFPLDPGGVNRLDWVGCDWNLYILYITYVDIFRRNVNTSTSVRENHTIHSPEPSIIQILSDGFHPISFSSFSGRLRSRQGSSYALWLISSHFIVPFPSWLGGWFSRWFASAG